jgi:hypothetical protein
MSMQCDAGCKCLLVPLLAIPLLLTIPQVIAAPHRLNYELEKTRLERQEEGLLSKVRALISCKS